jgi:hypothetical protein
MFQILWKSMRKRLRGKHAELKEKLRRRWHQSIAEQGQWQKSIAAGDFAYHAVPTNGRSLSAFLYHHVVQIWLRLLRRRSQWRNLPWDRMKPVTDEWISPRRHLPSPAEPTLRSQTPEAGAECVTTARSDMYGARGGPRPYSDWVVLDVTGERRGRCTIHRPHRMTLFGGQQDDPARPKGFAVAA